MKMASVRFVLCLIFVAVYGDVVRNPNVTIREIMNEIGDEFLDLITKEPASLQQQKTCEEPQESNIEFLLQTQSQPKNPIHLDSKDLKQIDAQKKVMVLIHGALSGSFGYGFPELIDAYLKRYDASVIMVDWSQYAWKAYPVSVCLLPKVAKIVGSFLCSLNKELKIDLSTVHVVGHSLGGQMSGLIGQDLQQSCGATLGRITALDPARLLFEDRDENERVDASDALFVDVLHTNPLGLGFYKVCGHVDFYVNCGTVQPGCPHKLPSVEEIPNLPLVYVSCEHMRALDYMVESISSNKFKGTSCGTCPSVCASDPNSTISNTLGEDCDANTRGAFYLTTNSQAPFANGLQ